MRAALLLLFLLGTCMCISQCGYYLGINKDLLLSCQSTMTGLFNFTATTAASVSEFCIGTSTSCHLSDVQTIVANVRTDCTEAELAGFSASNNVDLSLASFSQMLQYSGAFCTKAGASYCLPEVGKLIPLLSAGTGVSAADMPTLCSACTVALAKSLASITRPKALDETQSTLMNTLSIMCTQHQGEYCFPKFLSSIDKIKNFYYMNFANIAAYKTDFLEQSDIFCSPCVQKVIRGYNMTSDLRSRMAAICARDGNANLCTKPLVSSECFGGFATSGSPDLVACAQFKAHIETTETRCCLGAYGKILDNTLSGVLVDKPENACEGHNVSFSFSLSNLKSGAVSSSTFMAALNDELSLIVGSSVSIAYQLPPARSLNDISFYVNATAKSDVEADNKNYEIANSIYKGDIVLTATVQAAISNNFLLDSDVGLSLTLSSQVPSQPASYPASVSSPSGAGSIFASFFLVMLSVVLALLF